MTIMGNVFIHRLSIISLFAVAIQSTAIAAQNVPKIDQSKPILVIPVSTSYTGEITPIYKPILVRFRPYPKSRIIKRSKTSFSDGKQKFDVVSKLTGSSEVIKSGASVVQILKLEEITVEAQGQRKKEKIPITLKMKMSPRGDFQDISFQMPGMSAKEKRKSEKVVHLLMKFIGSMMPQLPKEGVSEKYEFYNRDKRTFDFGEDVATNVNINYSISGIARGRTTHRGREAIVVEYDGTLSMDNIRMKMTGYGLMDTYTGAWVLSDLSMTPNGLIQGENISGEMRETAEIHLHPSTPILTYSSLIHDNDNSLTSKKKGSAKSVEDRLKKLKKLLDGGLITKEEAAEKRADILKDI